jgi:serine protease Do
MIQKSFRLAAVVAASLCATTAFAEFKYKTDTELAAAVMPAYVNIYSRAAQPDESNPGGAPIIKDDVGSGFIVSPEGVIVTNRHVIEGAYSVFVTLHDGRNLPARLLGKALIYDVAFLKVDVPDPLPVVKIGDSDRLKIGDRVVAIGNPWGFPSSVSAGIVSAFHRTVGLSAYDDLIQTDAAINQGNSGGPLFDMDGEVVGVNQAIYTRNQGGSIGIGFSMPINGVKLLAESAIKFGAPRVGWLGIIGQTVTPSMARALNRGVVGGGVVISDLVPDAPAIRAGLMVGDVILQVEDRPIATIAALNQAVAISADRTVQIKVLRSGKETTLPVAIKQMSKEVWSTKLEDEPRIKSVTDFGVTLAPDPQKAGPIKVQTVVDKSLAWTAGLRAGDIVAKINDKAIRTHEDLSREVDALRTAGATDAMLLLTGPNGVRWVGISVRE